MLHVHTTYTAERTPTGRITDFVPGIAAALSEGSPMAAFYEGIVEEGDVLVPKTTFSAVLSSDLVGRSSPGAASTLPSSAGSRRRSACRRLSTR